MDCAELILIIMAANLPSIRSGDLTPLNESIAIAGFLCFLRLRHPGDIIHNEGNLGSCRCYARMGYNCKDTVDDRAGTTKSLTVREAVTTAEATNGLKSRDSATLMTPLISRASILASRWLYCAEFVLKTDTALALSLGSKIKRNSRPAGHVFAIGCGGLKTPLVRRFDGSVVKQRVPTYRR
jgi:hypothetical protein